MTTRPSNSAAAAAGPVVLWFEDFNAPPPETAADAPPPEPMFSAADLEAARRQAWNEGYLAAGAAAERSDARAARDLFSRLLAQLDAMSRDLEQAVGRNALALARWLAGAFMTALPTLSEAAMQSRIEVAGDLLREVLRSASRIEVAAAGQAPVACAAADEAWRAVERIRAETPDVRDITITWAGGGTRIEMQRHWDRIRAALLPFVERWQDATDDDQFMTHSAGPDHVG